MTGGISEWEHLTLESFLTGWCSLRTVLCVLHSSPADIPDVQGNTGIHLPFKTLENAGKSRITTERAAAK